MYAHFYTTGNDESPDLLRSRRRRFDFSSLMCLGDEMEINLPGASILLGGSSQDL